MRTSPCVAARERYHGSSSVQDAAGSGAIRPHPCGLRREGRQSIFGRLPLLVRSIGGIRLPELVAVGLALPRSWRAARGTKRIPVLPLGAGRRWPTCHHAVVSSPSTHHRRRTAPSGACSAGPEPREDRPSGVGCGPSRAVTALSRSSAQSSSDARRPLLFCPFRRSAVGTSPPSAPCTSRSRPGRRQGGSASLWPVRYLASRVAAR